MDYILSLASQNYDIAVCTPSPIRSGRLLIDGGGKRSGSLKLCIATHNNILSSSVLVKLTLENSLLWV